MPKDRIRKHPAMDWSGKIKEILLSPISSFKYNPEPFSINKKLETGDRLMHPTSAVRHTTTHTVEDGDWFWEVTHTGYWAGHTSQVLFVKDKFRGELPIWSLETRWCFAEIIRGDKKIADEIWKLTAQAEHQRYKNYRQDRLFVPRIGLFGPSSGLKYQAAWTGTLDLFFGSEYVEYDLQALTAWKAVFSGGTILPIS